MPFLAKVAKKHRGEARIAPRSEHGEAVTSGPEQHSCEPLLEAKANGGGQRAVDDREHARCAAQEDGGLVTVLRRSPVSLCHLGFECERADAAQI